MHQEQFTHRPEQTNEETNELNSGGSSLADKAKTHVDVVRRARERCRTKRNHEEEMALRHNRSGE